MTKSDNYSDGTERCCPDCGSKGEYRCSDRHRSYYTCETHGDYTVHDY